jgi:hypothetical protein
LSTKKCITCKLQTKAPGVHRCWECDTANRPAELRMQRADWRLAAVPEVLRLTRVPSAVWPPGRRWCAGCQSFVRLSDCARDASQCLTCTGRVAHASMLARTYTIHGRPFTADDYSVLYEKQGGRCPICLRKSVTKRLAVDHDHVTNEVRGLLDPGQHGCNLAILGNIKDLAMAKRIVEYLENPPANRWIRD